MTNRLPIAWVLKEFESLDVHELYAVMRARQAAFVVEQRCCYQDADGLDVWAWHLLGTEPSGKLVSYLRIIPPGRKYSETSLGRLVVESGYREHGYGRDAVREAIRRAEQLFPNSGIRGSAQAHLQRFYEHMGFQKVRGPYLEDGIPHLEMYRAPKTRITGDRGLVAQP
jgi:ElaA protein